MKEHYRELADAVDAPAWAAQLVKYWVNDWGYMHCDLHSIGYLLDPEYHEHSRDCGADVWTEFARGTTRMLAAAPDGYTFARLTAEYADYRNKRGCFTSATLELAQHIPAHEWWQQWGRGVPVLAWVAKRALAQTTAASCSEQAWSEYDYIHSRRRNRLNPDRASKLVRGHCLARLVRKFGKYNYQQQMHVHTDSEDDEEDEFSD